MILHTLNKPEAMEACRLLISDEDQVILLEDGVYLALTEKMQCLVIAADVSARGLTGRLSDNVRLISYSDFVRLSVEADKVCSWF